MFANQLEFWHEPAIQELAIVPDQKPEKPEAPEWITAKAAAEIMGVSVSNVYYLCRAGIITRQRFGRVWQVDKAAAEAYKRSKRNPEWLHPKDKNL